METSDTIQITKINLLLAAGAISAIQLGFSSGNGNSNSIFMPALVFSLWYLLSSLILSYDAVLEEILPSGENTTREIKNLQMIIYQGGGVIGLVFAFATYPIYNGQLAWYSYIVVFIGPSFLILGLNYGISVKESYDPLAQYIVDHKYRYAGSHIIPAALALIVESGV